MDVWCVCVCFYVYVVLCLGRAVAQSVGIVRLRTQAMEF
jgi:hypothetical protein